MAEEHKRALKVFLCHASADKPAVRALYQRLVREGVDAWLDKAKLLPGQDWGLEIPKAVKESDVVVVCLSNSSITKEGYVQKEIKIALDAASEKPEGTIFLIPARLEECNVPSQLGLWQWVDLFEPDGYEWLMRSLRLRADKIGAALQNSPYVDEELEQRIDQLYTEGLAALWVEDWDKACHRFQTILRERPHHLQAAAKLEEAERQKHLNTLYIQALDAQKGEDWQAAVEILEKLTGKAVDYKDAALLLKVARKKNQLAHLYEEARKLYRAEQWQAVVRVFVQIAAIEPDYQDVDRLLLTAEKKVAELKRLDELGKLYGRAVREMDSGRWHEALSLLTQIQGTGPGFLETERLLAKADAEVKKIEEKQWREDQINTLYEQARGLFQSQMWREALSKLDEIRQFDERFPDPDQIAKQSQVELERQEQEIELHNKLSAMYAEAARLLREKKYQNALEKWQEIVKIDPNYSDPQKVQLVSKRKLGELTKSLQSGPRIVNLKQAGIISFLVITLAGIVWFSSQNLDVPTSLPTPVVYKKWTFDNDTEGWGRYLTYRDISSPTAIDGSLTFDTKGSDPFIFSPSMNISAFTAPMITVSMSIRGIRFRGAIYFITNKDRLWGEDKKRSFPLLAGEAFEIYHVDMSQVSAWKDVITQIRLDPVDEPDVTSEVQIAIDYISVHAP